MFLIVNGVIVASSTVSFLSKNAYISSSFYIKYVRRYAKKCKASTLLKVNQFLFSLVKWQTPFQFRIGVIFLPWLFTAYWYKVTTRGKNTFKNFLLRPSKFLTSCQPMFGLICRSFSSCKANYSITFLAIIWIDRSLTRPMLNDSITIVPKTCHFQEHWTAQKEEIFF